MDLIGLAILPNDYTVLGKRDGRLFVTGPLLNINQLNVQ